MSGEDQEWIDQCMKKYTVPDSDRLKKLVYFLKQADEE